MIRGLLLLVAVPLCAHKFHYSATEINWNSTQAAMEIVVTLHAEDIESLFRLKQGRVVELDCDASAETMVCGYLAAVLEIRGVALRCLGMKVGREFAEVFLEGKPANGRPSRWLRNQILLRELADQRNHVVLKRDGKPAGKPVDFSAGEDWKKLNW